MKVKRTCKNCNRHYRSLAKLVRHDPDAEVCERHEHCAVCGKVLSVYGAEYRLKPLQKAERP